MTDWTPPTEAWCPECGRTRPIPANRVGQLSYGQQGAELTCAVCAEDAEVASGTALRFSGPSPCGWQERPTASLTSLTTAPDTQYGRAHWWECRPAGDDACQPGVWPEDAPTTLPGVAALPIPTLRPPAQWYPDDPADGVPVAYLPGREEWGWDRPVPYTPLDRPLQRYSAGYYSLLNRPRLDVAVAWARQARPGLTLAKIMAGDDLADILGRPVPTRADLDDGAVRIGPAPRLAHAELLVQLRDANTGSGRRTWELADYRRCRLTVRSRRTGEVTRWRLRDRDARELLERVVLPALAAQALDALALAAE